MDSDQAARLSRADREKPRSRLAAALPPAGSAEPQPDLFFVVTDDAAEVGNVTDALAELLLDLVERDRGKARTDAADAGAKVPA
jgi:hypothetical protein